MNKILKFFRILEKRECRNAYCKKLHYKHSKKHYGEYCHYSCEDQCLQ